MDEIWGFNRFRFRLDLLLVSCLLHQNLEYCWSLNAEVLALLRFRERIVRDPYSALSSWNRRDDKEDPCSCFGVGCSDGEEVILNIAQDRDAAYRRLLEVADASHSPKANTHKNEARKRRQMESSPSHSPALSPSLSPSSSPKASRRIFLPPPPSPAPTLDLPSPAPPDPPIVLVASPPSYSTSRRGSERSNSHSKHRVRWPIFSGVVVGSFLLISVIGIFLYQRTKVLIAKPWASGLSGQLQKALLTGVPKLKRSELELACEDFSNIIGSSSDGIVYKGTLSNGVEIAVTSTAVTSAKNWSKQQEMQFRKMIDTLSKVNHKNFANLIGYCKEHEPFTRMMVFEYASNGTLFEHLHIKEAEHLDWGVRLRVMMGMAYCLEHMHQLTPPVIHKDLQSTTVYLTEDYAAKISDHGFWNVAAAAKMRSVGTELVDTNLESNVYSIGVIFLEMITGRLAYSEDNGPLVDWASYYLRRERPVKDMVDPTLKSFQEEELEKLCEVIRSCIHANPKQRLTMKEVTARLREITAMAPDGAAPKLSPLWWAELEILSTEAS